MLYPVYKVEPCGLTYLGANVGSWRKMATNGDVIFACFEFGIESLKVTCIESQSVLLKNEDYITKPTLYHYYYTTELSASKNYLLLAGGWHKSQNKPNIGRV